MIGTQYSRAYDGGGCDGGCWGGAAAVHNTHIQHTFILQWSLNHTAMHNVISTARE